MFTKDHGVSSDSFKPPFEELESISRPEKVENINFSSEPDKNEQARKRREEIEDQLWSWGIHPDTVID